MPMSNSYFTLRSFLDGNLAFIRYFHRADLHFPTYFHLVPLIDPFFIWYIPSGSSYFSPSGLEYNIGRVNMGGCDFSWRTYTYADAEGDVELSTFALQPEDTDYKVGGDEEHTHTP